MKKAFLRLSVFLAFQMLVAYSFIPNGGPQRKLLKKLVAKKIQKIQLLLKMIILKEFLWG
jgi:hypothetical protein